MSLLTKPRHQVKVQNRVKTQTPHGIEWTNDGPTLSVRCTVNNVSDTEIQDNGVRLLTSKYLLTKTWPGNPDCLVGFDGMLFEQTGLAPLYDGSQRVRHYEVALTFVGMGVLDG